MSRQDPGAATGAGIYPPARRCTCGEVEAVHTLTGGVRRGCARGGCRCRAFEPAPVDPDRCPTCGAHRSAIEAIGGTP